MDVVYHIDDPSNLRRISLDEMQALYHRLSGQTHILMEPAPQIIDCLLERPADAHQIMTMLEQQYTFIEEKAEVEPEQGRVLALVRERLEEMEQLGIVNRLEADPAKA